MTVLPPRRTAEQELDALLDRLASYGVANLEAWARLTPKQRAGLWGITRRHRQILDRLARRRR